MKTPLLSSIFICLIAFVATFSSCEKDQPIPDPKEPTKGTVEIRFVPTMNGVAFQPNTCLLYTSDAADE